MRRISLLLLSFCLLWGLLAIAISWPDLASLSHADASGPAAGKPLLGPGHRSPAAGSGLDRVEGPPSIRRSQVDLLLCQAGSPACGSGEILYDDMVQAGINPAFALAIFWHESQFGRLGVARLTHSLGNIRCSPGWPSCLAGYRSYSSWPASYVDFAELMTHEYFPRGLVSVEQILPVYAPAADGNDPAVYIYDVLAHMKEWSLL